MAYSLGSKFVAIIFSFINALSLVLEFVDRTLYENHENWYPMKKPFTVGKRRLQTCPSAFLGVGSAHKDPYLPMAIVPGSRSKFGNWKTVPSLYNLDIPEYDAKI